MSKPYMLSYDLNAPGQKYEDVKDTIKEFGGSYIKLQESFWLLRTDLTPNEMMDKLNNSIDKSDVFYICELTDNYQGRAIDKDWKFIRENIFRR